MCGICGVYHTDQQRPVQPDLLRAMAGALAHRGPDDEGSHVDGCLGLAHKRLSIIDLSDAGRQPMTNESGRFWIVLNGEIYNYIELRQRLAARGHTFRSNTDTEVVLHLYEECGPDCVKELNGMYAFAVWDRDERTVFAARDRFGIKPFYYSWSGGTFAFASEIKALVSGGVRPQLNADGLSDYLTFQFCLGPKTLFAGIDKLEPGHSLLVKGDGSLSVRKYWDLDFTVDAHHTVEYFEHQLARLIEDAVRLELRADVPVGAHLSGGLDSSTVTCLAGSLLGGGVHTFTGAFREGPSYDETRYARLVAAGAGATAHEVYPTAEEFVQSMPRLMYQMDEPVAGPGLFPQYAVSKLAREHVKVVLGGQGGDEIFGGYTRYLIAYLEECIRGGIQGTQEDDKYVVSFESILPNLTQLRGYEPLLRHFWAAGVLDPPDRRYFRLIDRSGDLHGVIEPGVTTPRSGYQPFEAYLDLFNSGAPQSYINRMTRFDIQTLLPALLHVEDRTSMAVSLESRVPLLDHRIAELVAAIPPKIKYGGGRSKHILRRVVRHFVPREIEERSDKMGFPVPLNEWYRRDPVRSFIRETLTARRAKERGLFRPLGLEELLCAERPYGRGVWAALCLELWMQAFLDR